MNLIQLNVALILGYVFYGLTLLIHGLVLGRIIPYHLVNGGRSASFEAQKKVSVMSLGIALLGIIFIALNHVFPNLHSTLVYGIIAWVLTAYWGLGYILQWLGTWLEKYVISWVLIMGILSHLILGILAFR